MAIIDFDTSAVIDMGLIQQIANAVNRHDDILISFTNDSSSAIEETVTETSVKRYFDPSSSAIMFGQETLNVSNSVAAGTITFPSSFLAAPTVTVTRAMNERGADPWHLWVSEVGTDSFFLEGQRYDNLLPNRETVNGTIVVYWMAIGSKVSS